MDRNYLSSGGLSRQFLYIWQNSFVSHDFFALHCVNLSNTTMLLCMKQKLVYVFNIRGRY